MSDGDFYQKVTHYMPILKQDVNMCDNAINDGDTTTITNAGGKMVNDCSTAKQKTKPIEVSDQVQVLKDLFIELIEALIQAGNSLHNGDVDTGNDQLQNAKQIYNNFKNAVDNNNPNLLAQM